MPALTTHFLFGEKVLTECPEELSVLIREHLPLFNSAAQGPDLLFFRCAISGKSFLPKVGGRMHSEKISETLNFMKQYTADHRDDDREYPVLMTYFLGFICHYYLDKTVHPYVYFLVDSIRKHHPEKTDTSVHTKIESELDSILYQMFKKEPVTKFSVRDHFTVPQEEKDIVGKMYEKMLAEVYGEYFPAAEISKAFDDMKTLNSLLYDQTGILMTASNILGELFPKTLDLTAQLKPKHVSTDTANFFENCWHHPQNPNMKSRKSVLALFNDAKEEVLTALKSTYDTIADGGPVHFDTDLDFCGNMIEL